MYQPKNYQARISKEPTNHIERITWLCDPRSTDLGSLSAARNLDLILASRDGIGELIGLGFNLFGIDCGVDA